MPDTPTVRVRTLDPDERIPRRAGRLRHAIHVAQASLRPRPDAASCCGCGRRRVRYIVPQRTRPGYETYCAACPPRRTRIEYVIDPEVRGRVPWDELDRALDQAYLNDDEGDD